MSGSGDQIAPDTRAMQLFRELIRAHKADLMPAAHWGDGACGAYLVAMREEFGLFPAAAEKPKKQKIGAELQRRVHERYAYRCVVCGSHTDLTCDHIIPESAGGETTEANLQTMCRSCNCRKGTKGVV